MNDFSIIEKLKILVGVITSSPAYLILTIIGIASLVLIILLVVLNKKINKWYFIGIWALAFIILIFKYNNYLLTLVDNLFNSVFMALYFPNLSIYLIILISSNFLFIYSFIKKDVDKGNRILNAVNCVITDILLVLILNVVVKNQINIYDTLTTYSNPQLLVLLELSSAIFTSYMLLVFLLSAHRKLKKYDKQEIEKIIIEDEVPTFKNDKIFVWKKI